MLDVLKIVGGVVVIAVVARAIIAWVELKNARAEMDT